MLETAYLMNTRIKIDVRNVKFHAFNVKVQKNVKNANQIFMLILGPVWKNVIQASILTYKLTVVRHVIYNVNNVSDRKSIF